MAAQFWTDAARMAGCGLIVAAVAVPLGIAARIISKRFHQPILKTVRRWSVPWGGFEVLILFLTVILVPAAVVSPLLAASGFYPAVYGPGATEEIWMPMKPLWASVVFAPLFIGFLWWVLRLAYPNWRAEPAAPAARVAGGTATWLVLHPIVAGVYLAVAAVFLSVGWQPDAHPLELKFREGRPVVDMALFAIQAAIAAPLVEEIVFRGALLPWLLGKRGRPAIAMLIATVLAISLSIQQDANSQTDFRIGPAIFAGLLLAGGVALQIGLKRHRRSVGAIYGSAAFFALVHSSVWPTPIPLFVLGLGLGWLAIRTRGILAPWIVHGLFNGVSVLFVLRS